MFIVGGDSHLILNIALQSLSRVFHRIIEKDESQEKHRIPGLPTVCWPQRQFFVFLRLDFTALRVSSSSKLFSAFSIANQELERRQRRIEEAWSACLGELDGIGLGSGSCEDNDLQILAVYVYRRADSGQSWWWAGEIIGRFSAQLRRQTWPCRLHPFQRPGWLRRVT